MTDDQLTDVAKQLATLHGISFIREVKLKPSKRYDLWLRSQGTILYISSYLLNEPEKLIKTLEHGIQDAWHLDFGGGLSIAFNRERH